MRSRLKVDTRAYDLAFGRRVKLARLNAGLTQAQMAQHLGLSFSTVFAGLETGRRRFQVADLPLLSEILNVSVEWLVLGDQ